MKVICVVGTRPEAIKMAPVIMALKKTNGIVCRVLATAQHREMLDQVFSIFGIIADIDLNIMQPSQRLPELTTRLLTRLDEVFAYEKPDIVLAQGDTTTVMVTALACFYQKVSFGHIEAGLRTQDLYNPYPEEANRIIAGHLAKWHFAPTQRSKENLLREGINENAIHVIGNTVIDALMDVSKRCNKYYPDIDKNKKIILVTAHRRENFGDPIKNICQALLSLANQHNDILILYPVHPNPNVSEPVHSFLGNNPNIILCQPMEYLSFVAAMSAAYFIITDSGGVQEEAPALGKPVLVLRSETERPEAVDAGVVKLVGSDQATILRECNALLSDKDYYRVMARGASPYGDGNAAMRIVSVLSNIQYQPFKGIEQCQEKS